MENVKETVVEENDTVEDVIKQSQVETVEKAQYDAVLAELEELKGKLPQEPTDAEKGILTKQKELWTKEMNLELKQAGLSDFAEFFFVEEGNSEMLQTQIKRFKDTLSKRELNNSFVPSDHRNVDKYSLAEKNKDTKSMIGSKLSKLFK